MSKLDVVYVYKKVPSSELAWSIESLKNIEHGQVYIVGDSPDYEVAATVIKPIKHEWAVFSPYHDVISKCLTICDTPEISEDFVFANDDMFVMLPMEPVNYNQGTLTEHINRRGPDSYSQVLMNTRDLLLQNGYDELDFDLHTPMLMNKTQLRVAIEELIVMLALSKKVMIRSYYGNRFKTESTYMEDVKDVEDCRNKTLLSTTEQSFHDEIGDYIREKISAEI